MVPHVIEWCQLGVRRRCPSRCMREECPAVVQCAVVQIYIIRSCVWKLHPFRLQLGPPPRRSRESVTKSDKRRGGAACWTSRLHIPTRGIHPSFRFHLSKDRGRGLCVAILVLKVRFVSCGVHRLPPLLQANSLSRMGYCFFDLPT
jgi:hypothetical protein